MAQIVKVAVMVEETKSPRWLRLTSDEGISAQVPAELIPEGMRREGTRLVLRVES